MPYSCFISDLHLNAERPDITRALSDFLLQHQACDALFILGDLFETWVGDDDDDDLACQVRSLLHGFTRAGPRLYLVPGNRDFLIAQRFCADTGAELIPEGGVVDLYGTPTLLLHGDSLCTDDRDYQALRQTLRQPRWQADFLAQSLASRREQAAGLRNLSRTALVEKAESITDVNADAVDRVMAEQDVGCLIHGHTHRPGRHDCRHGERLVLGDWDRWGWWIRADVEQLELTKFDINQ